MHFGMLRLKDFGQLQYLFEVLVSRYTLRAGSEELGGTECRRACAGSYLSVLSREWENGSLW